MSGGTALAALPHYSDIVADETDDPFLIDILAPIESETVSVSAEAGAAAGRASAQEVVERKADLDETNKVPIDQVPAAKLIEEGTPIGDALAGKLDPDRLGETPYTREGGTVATPLYLRKTLAKIDVEDHCRASNPETHRAGWQQALNLLAQEGGGSIKAPDAPFVFNDATVADAYSFDGSGNLVVNQKGFVLSVEGDMDIELNLHADTRFVAGPGIRSTADGTGGMSTTPTDAIKTSGSLLYFRRSGQPNGAPLRQLSIIGGLIDVSAIAASSTSVDAFTAGGDWRVYMERVRVDHGRKTPAVTAPGVGTVGSGGGDSSFFFSNCPYIDLVACEAIGAPDLAVYLSGSGIIMTRITDFRASNCLSGIAGKRNAGRIEINNPNFTDMQNGVFGGTTGDSPLGHSREIVLRGGKMTRMQGDPIRLDNGLNCVVDGTVFEDIGRLVADPAQAFSRSISNLAAAVKLDGASRCQVRNIDVRFKDLVPPVTAGREFVGIALGVFSGTGASSSACSFSSNRFAGKDAANPLFADYMADSASATCTFDLAPSSQNVSNVGGLIAGTGHSVGRAVRYSPDGTIDLNGDAAAHVYDAYAKLPVAAAKAAFSSRAGATTARIHSVMEDPNGRVMQWLSLNGEAYAQWGTTPANFFRLGTGGFYFHVNALPATDGGANLGSATAKFATGFFNNLRFGTYTAGPGAAVTGYITITDKDGNTRKLATVA